MWSDKIPVLQVFFVWKWKMRKQIFDPTNRVHIKFPIQQWRRELFVNFEHKKYTIKMINFHHKTTGTLCTAIAGPSSTLYPWKATTPRHQIPPHSDCQPNSLRPGVAYRWVSARKLQWSYVFLVPTHRYMHLQTVIVGSGHGLWHVWSRAITCINVDPLSSGPVGTHLSENLVGTQKFL